MKRKEEISEWYVYKVFKKKTTAEVTRLNNFIYNSNIWNDHKGSFACITRSRRIYFYKTLQFNIFVLFA